MHVYQMGDFIGGVPQGRTHARHRYDTCPRCDQRKRADAKLCRTCSNKQRTMDQAEKLDRHARFELALASGCYTLDELRARAREGRLPTRGEILCKRWWKVTGEALNEEGTL